MLFPDLLFAFSGVSIIIFCVYLTYIYENKVLIPKAQKNIVSILEKHGFTFVRIERTENYIIHQINRDRGDFENGRFPLENFSKNKPLYYYVVYTLKNYNEEMRCTIRIPRGFYFYEFDNIEFKPSLW